MSLSRRPYSSPVREEQAEETRRLVLAAARLEFGRRGFAATTVDSIAAAARVSPGTVYATFRSKAGLLSALLANAGGDPDIRRLAEAAIGEAEPRTRLARAAHVVRAIMDREHDLLRVLVDAGRERPELRAAWSQVHRQQHSALTRAVTSLPLREGLKESEAVDTLSVLAGPDSYFRFVEEEGWTPERWETWLAESAVRLLLD